MITNRKLETNDNSRFDNLDLDRLDEGLRQHLSDVMGALAAIDRIRSWCTPHLVAGVQSVANLGGTLEPTANGVGPTLWVNAVAILRNAGTPMMVGDIANAMQASGVVSRSANFANTMNSVMTKRKEVFHKIATNLWGLHEWNNNSLPPEHSSQAQLPNVTPLRAKANQPAKK